MNIFIDIETIPCQQEGFRDAIEVQAPGNYKKQESIDKWLEEHGEEVREAEYRKSALDGLYGEIVVICYENHNGLAMFVQTEEANEFDMLEEFNRQLYADLGYDGSKRQPTFIGHNVGFDLKFIYKRMVVNGITPLFKIPHGDAPWKGTYIDTMQLWDGKSWVGLDRLCKALGIEVDDAIDGSKVWDHWKEGDRKTVIKHCSADVERVRQLYNRLTFS